MRNAKWSNWFPYSGDECPIPIGTYCCLKIFDVDQIYYVEDYITNENYKSEAWKISSITKPRVIEYRYPMTASFQLLKSLL